MDSASRSRRIFLAITLGLIASGALFSFLPFLGSVETVTFDPRGVQPSLGKGFFPLYRDIGTSMTLVGLILTILGASKRLYLLTSQSFIKKPSLSKLIFVGLVLVAFEFVFFRLAPWGDGIAPFYFPGSFTILYAIWSRNLPSSFAVGFLSLISMFSGPILFYMQSPPIHILNTILMLGLAFGVLGMLFSMLSNRLSRIR